MPASYRASRDIAESVGDPLQMAVAAEKGEMELSIEDVVNVIYVGCKHAGCSLTKEQVGDAMFDAGIATYIETVGQYIGLMVMGGPERPVRATAKKKRRTGSKS